MKDGPISLVSPQMPTVAVAPFDETLDFLTPVLAVVPCQLLAYCSARFLGREIDKPRNLAKSVTVE
jgi:glucosamine--fructose-6-phosphate aminotransferase (isomerizing)